MRSFVLRFVRRIERELAPQPEPTSADRVLDIDGISLKVCFNDYGGRVYAQRPAFEEARSLFWKRVAEILQPQVVVDIGANYGFTASVFSRAFPDAELILIEPDPKLTPYITHNMAANNITDYRLIEAVCSDREGDQTFAINPDSSQDNRVQGLDGWESVTVPSVTLSSVLNESRDSRILIKIDVQGFEQRVFDGGQDFLANSNQWLIRTEFAPCSLQTQGTSPEVFLGYLIERYHVVEAPLRTRFKHDGLQGIFSAPLKSTDVSDFVEHVSRLNRDGLGWVDLYVAPETRSW